MIFIVGITIAVLCRKAVRKVLSRGKLKDERMLISLAGNAVRWVVIVFTGIMALKRIGLDMGPFLVSLGAGGIVVGFAFRDTLSNFASGLLVLIYRPFRVNDTVDVGGTMGQVLELTLVNTKLKDFSGPEVYLPNSKVWGSKIINYSRAQFRRAVFAVGISYDDDQQKAREIMLTLINEEERILKDPAPFIRLNELADSSVNFQLYVYCKPSDYGSLLNDFYSKTKQALDSTGISIPYPQTDIHHYPATKSE